MMTEHLHRMARNNQWMNKKLYAKVVALSDAEIAKDRGAFFSSILGTLNHVLVADMFWLRRISSPSTCKEALVPMRDKIMPTSLHDMMYDNIQTLTAERQLMDGLIFSFSQTWGETMLRSQVRYRNTKGEKHQQPLAVLLQHLFNHQTHHRGQVTILLFQAGIDPEATDLLVIMMEEG